jgi:hypothetical protein
MELIAAICVGLGLSAAGGLRLFVPLLIAGVAERFGAVHLAPVLAWTASAPALAVLSLLSLCEALAYCIPAVDHALDVVSAPAAWLAGALLASGAVAPELHSMLSTGDHWPNLAAHGAYAAGLAGTAACGIGAALATRVTSATGRIASTATTAGFANPLYAALESLLAFATSILALLAPIALGVLGLLLIVLVFVTIRHRARRARVAVHAMN